MSKRRRWLRFNLVGVLGFALQMALIFVLVRWTALGASAAVTVAVLAAVSHNFVWHEHFTWPDRPREARLRRWLSFHLSTGVLSVAGNVGVTMILANETGLPLVVCNAVAVVIVSAANYWVGDRWIFNALPNAQCSMPNAQKH
jgi:putative flippase GtrA